MTYAQLFKQQELVLDNNEKLIQVHSEVKSICENNNRFSFCVNKKEVGSGLFDFDIAENLKHIISESILKSIKEQSKRNDKTIELTKYLYRELPVDLEADNTDSTDIEELPKVEKEVTVPHGDFFDEMRDEIET